MNLHTDLACVEIIPHGIELTYVHQPYAVKLLT